MLEQRVTYFSEAGPQSRKTRGLIKVGQSRNPERRALVLGTRLIGTTSLGEGVLRQLLAPFAVAPEEIAARHLDHPREWYHDRIAVRWLALWACEVHPGPGSPPQTHEAAYTEAGSRIRLFPAEVS